MSSLAILGYHSDMARSRVIFDASPDEKARLEELRQQYGMRSVSEVLRRLIGDAPPANPHAYDHRHDTPPGSHRDERGFLVWDHPKPAARAVRDDKPVGPARPPATSVHLGPVAAAPGSRLKKGAKT